MPLLTGLIVISLNVNVSGSRITKRSGVQDKVVLKFQENSSLFLEEPSFNSNHQKPLPSYLKEAPASSSVESTQTKE